ncbi:MAG: MATE family efflux transporter [Desulfovibrionaceae bacterium]
MIKTNISDTNYRAIWSLVWPQALTLVTTLLISLTDVWIAGRIDSETLATFGMLSQIILFLSIIGQGITGSTLALVGQALGANKKNRAKRLAFTMILLSLVMGSCVSSIAYFLRDFPITFFRTPKFMVDNALWWLSLYLTAIPMQYLFLTTNSVIRSIKEVRFILIVAICTCLYNVAVSLLLAFGFYNIIPAFGAFGIVYATLSTFTIASITNCIYLYKRSILRIEFLPTLRWIQSVAHKIISVGLPIIGMQLLWQIGYMVVFLLMANLPENGRLGVAGFTIGLRIESILFIPGMAMQFTASILISRLVGAKQALLARNIGTKLILSGTLFITLCSIPIWIFMDNIALFFTADIALQEEIKLYLFYNLLIIPCIMITITSSGIFTGAGTTMYTFLAFSISMWVIRIPIAYVCGYLYKMNSEGVYIAMSVSAFIQSLIILYFYIGKRWEGK